MKNEMTKLAGVTFCNEPEDGGAPRQDIIASIAKTRGGIITVDLKHTTFCNEKTGEKEPAIKCVEHATKQVIGWIPRTEISKLEDVNQMTGFINLYKGTYYVELSAQQMPTREQYHYVKDLCAKYNLVMPAYDRRAYATVFAYANDKKKK